MRLRNRAWRKAGSPLPPRGVLAEDFSLLIRAKRVRLAPRESGERVLPRHPTAKARVALLN